jgi:peptide/nickel transport system substrate-binding protein
MRDLAGVEATKPDTVVVSFSKPMPAQYFAAVISGMISYIVPRHVYAGSDMNTNPANNAPIGTGPWKLRQWVRGGHMEFARNDDYWQKGLPYLDRLILRFLRDPASRAAAMEAGEIQLGVGNPTTHPEIRRLAASGKLVMTTKGYSENAWAATLECNVRNPIFAKREVRQAIFHAMDRNWIARTVYYGFARPGTGPVYSTNTEFYAKDTTRIEFDPKKAGEMLDAAGYPKKADGKRFTVNLMAGGWSTELPKIGTYAKQALDDIGIAATFFTGDFATSTKRIYTDYDFDIAVSSQINPTEPIPWTTRFFTSDGIRKGCRSTMPPATPISRWTR